MTTIKDFFASESWRKLREISRPGEGVVGGVCAALGSGTPLAAWMWRALFCTLTVVWGFGVVAYIILWLSIPERSDESA